jgi:hypothetical protein
VYNMYFQFSKGPSSRHPPSEIPTPSCWRSLHLRRVGLQNHTHNAGTGFGINLWSKEKIPNSAQENVWCESRPPTGFGGMGWVYLLGTGMCGKRKVLLWVGRCI